jgi:hypothetical protein
MGVVVVVVRVEALVGVRELGRLLIIILDYREMGVVSSCAWFYCK